MYASRQGNGLLLHTACNTLARVNKDKAVGNTVEHKYGRVAQDGINVTDC